MQPCMINAHAVKMAYTHYSSIVIVIIVLLLVSAVHVVGIEDEKKNDACHLHVKCHHIHACMTVIQQLIMHTCTLKKFSTDCIPSAVFCIGHNN